MGGVPALVPGFLVVRYLLNPPPPLSIQDAGAGGGEAGEGDGASSPFQQSNQARDDQRDLLDLKKK